MQACEWGIPVVVLIRNPKDAVVSGVALSKQVRIVEHNIEVPEQQVPFKDRIWAWNVFYRALLPYRDRLLVITLGAVVEDMGHVIDRVNDCFDTDFRRFEHTPKTVTEVHARQGYHAGPSERRTELKKEVRAHLDEQLRTDSGFREALLDAETLYEDFVSGPRP
jgi:hypothetical protein